MAHNRPQRPFAVHIQVMQRPFFVQAGICGIGILQNFIGEKDFLGRDDNLGQPAPIRKIRVSATQETLNY